MKSLILTLSTAAVIAASVGTLPAAAYDQTDARQYNQQQRINQGVRSGQITGREYQQLQTEQARIAQLERQAKADGYVSSAERARLSAAQNNASRHIAQESHDGESRWNRWWGGRRHSDSGYRRWWW
jgi:uncharacterized membrane protein YebE (DUF533 family)